PLEFAVTPHKSTYHIVHASAAGRRPTASSRNPARPKLPDLNTAINGVPACCAGGSSPTATPDRRGRCRSHAGDRAGGRSRTDSRAGRSRRREVRGDGDAPTVLERLAGGAQDV